MKKNKGEIIIYKNKSGKGSVDVRLEKETIWLTQKQIAIIFDIQRPAITKHIKNIFKEGELNENSVCSILEHTASDVTSLSKYNLSWDSWKCNARFWW